MGTSTAGPGRATRNDVAKFLSAHEECASDFDIRRTAGIGKGLRVVCNGCGTRAAYTASESGALTLVDPPAPGRREGGRRLTREEVERWLPAPAALPWWIPNAYILAIIAVGLAMIAFGLSQSTEQEPVVVGEREEPASAVPPPAAAAPTGAPANSAAADAGGKSKRSGLQAAAAKLELDPVTVLGRFRIGVAEGWLRGTSGGAIVLRTGDDDAEVKVFLEPGDAGPRRLARRAVEFLRNAHPGAEISRPQRVRVGDDPAVALSASYDGGRERALLLSESGFEYLLLSRTDADASRTEKVEALAVLRSFRAL